MKPTQVQFCVAVLLWSCATASYAQPPLDALGGSASPQRDDAETIAVSPSGHLVGGRPVRLDELLRYAEDRAPTVRVADAERRLSDGDAARAAQRLPDNPVVLVGVGPRVGAAAPSGGPQLFAVAQVTQRFEVGGQRRARRAVARASRESRERALERTRWHLHHEVHDGYQQVLVLRHRAEVARELEGFAHSMVDVARASVAAGEASPLVERLARVGLVRARQRAMRSLQVYREGCIALATLVGWPPGTPPEPVGSLDAPRRSPSLANLSAAAEANNATLADLNARVTEAERRVELARREGRPDVTLGIRYAFEGEAPGESARHVVLGLLRMPITSAARNQGPRADAAAARTVAEAERDAALVALRGDLERLRTAVDSAAVRVEAMSADVLPGFVDNLAMLRAAFELGEVDLTDVSVALEALLEARMQALDAHAAYLAAVAALEAAVGQEVWTETEVTR